MNDVEKFDLFNLGYHWDWYKTSTHYVVEFRPRGAKYSECITGITLNLAFRNVFNFLNY